jgi:hypothetical protein
MTRLVFFAFTALAAALLHRDPRPVPRGADDFSFGEEYFQHLAQQYDNLRFSVVRIMSAGAHYNWLAPFASGGGTGTSVGTGWVLEDGNDPVFITNAHVVFSAPDVAIQVLPLGHFKFRVAR